MKKVWLLAGLLIVLLAFAGCAGVTTEGEATPVPPMGDWEGDWESLYEIEKDFVEFIFWKTNRAELGADPDKLTEEIFALDREKASYASSITFEPYSNRIVAQTENGNFVVQFWADIEDESLFIDKMRIHIQSEIDPLTGIRHNRGMWQEKR